MEGTARVTCDDNGTEKLLNNLQPGDSFGELALMHSCPRSATVVAIGHVTTFAIGRHYFQELLRCAAFERRKEYIHFLDNVPLLSSLEPGQRQKLADAVIPVDYNAGDIIISQGDLATGKFHIIAQGSAVVTIRGKDEKKKLVRGQFFGEVALLKDRSPTASVIAETPVKALTLDRDSFQRLLGPVVEELLRGHMATYSFGHSVSMGNFGAKGTASVAKPVPTVAVSNLKLEHYDAVDFSLYKEIGQGFTGNVYLCHNNRNNKPCVLKVMKKEDVIRMGEVEHIINERRALAALHHPFVVEMLGSFQDSECLYIVMEFIRGGELFMYMEKKGRLSLSAARFYAAEVLVALEYIHSQGYVYRDLKPENVLITESGHVKIVDMGFAKHLKDHERCYTFCGTPDYLCPEVLQNTGHGKPVDFWAFGILLYEMLAGYAPFTDQKLMVTYQNILFGKLNFPEGFDPVVIDLIRNLLVADTTHRYGSMAGGVGQIKSHPFFNGIDWAAVSAMQLTPPYLPSQTALPNTKLVPLPPDKNPVSPEDLEMFAEF
eukprot:jgi/Mesvir1/24525/Mv21866-RA.1